VVVDNPSVFHNHRRFPRPDAGTAARDATVRQGLDAGRRWICPGVWARATRSDHRGLG
jgi:hypothetical protein